MKAQDEQRERTREKAEVFTPSWVCNVQNNLVDDAWFGRENVFNTPDDKRHRWLTEPDPIRFPEGKDWVDYITANILEITCGEAPYLVSRYDATTGERIPVPHRIGSLDRKLRIVGENRQTRVGWLVSALEAVKSTYGYEWAEDNLWLARKNIVQTVKEHYRHKFGSPMPRDYVEMVAYVASWNIFRMDGIRMTIPQTCSPDCKGCKIYNKKLDESIHLHDGIPAVIMDWESGQPVELRELYRKDVEPNLFNQ